MGHFEISRETSIDAPPQQVRGHIEDLARWEAWSPWEELDPDLQRTYSDPSSGVGATYSWQGNKKAGIGSMEVTGITDERVDIRLRFEKPFKADNQVAFELVPDGDATRVTWRMSGEQKGLMGLMGKVISMDRLVGKDFEKGLASLKRVSEQG